VEREITRIDQDQFLDLDLDLDLGQSRGQDRFPVQGLALCPGLFPDHGLAAKARQEAGLAPPASVRSQCHGLAAGVDLPVRPGARMDLRVLRGGGPSLTASHALQVQLEVGMLLKVLLGAVLGLKVRLTAEMALRVLLVAEVVPKVLQEVGLAQDRPLGVGQDRRVPQEARQGVNRALEVRLDHLVRRLISINWPGHVIYYFITAKEAL